MNVGAAPPPRIGARCDSFASGRQPTLFLCLSVAPGAVPLPRSGARRNSFALRQVIIKAPLTHGNPLCGYIALAVVRRYLAAPLLGVVADSFFSSGS